MIIIWQSCCHQEGGRASHFWNYTTEVDVYPACEDAWLCLQCPCIPFHSGWVSKKILNMIVVTARKPREHLNQPSQFTHGENGTPQREFTLPADKHQLVWIPSHTQYCAITLLVFVDVGKMPQSRRKEFILWEGKGSRFIWGLFWNLPLIIMSR